MARLQGHKREILARLIRGPATNRELSEISLKYTGRISDVRKSLRMVGWDIACRDLGGGLTSYSLTPIQQPQPIEAAEPVDIGGV